MLTIAGGIILAIIAIALLPVILQVLGWLIAAAVIILLGAGWCWLVGFIWIELVLQGIMKTPISELPDDNITIGFFVTGILAAFSGLIFWLLPAGKAILKYLRLFFNFCFQQIRKIIKTPPSDNDSNQTNTENNEKLSDKEQITKEDKTLSLEELEEKKKRGVMILKEKNIKGKMEFMEETLPASENRTTRNEIESIG